MQEIRDKIQEIHDRRQSDESYKCQRVRLISGEVLSGYVDEVLDDGFTWSEFKRFGSIKITFTIPFSSVLYVSDVDILKG